MMKPNFLRSILTCLIFLYIFLLFLSPVEPGDIWWHVATGEWIAQHKQVPWFDVFSYDQQNIYGLSPQWLGSLFYYQIHQLSGTLGLKLFRAFFFMGIIGIFVAWARKKIPYYLLVLLALFFAHTMILRSNLRPYLFNFLFLQLFFIILFRFQKDAYSKIVWLIPVLSVVWLNIHMGCFVYGNILLATFLITDIFQYFMIKHRFPKERKKFSANLIRIKKLSLVYIAFLGVFIVNPYGLEGMLYPYRVFMQPHFINFDVLKNLINELQPPFFLLTGNGCFFHALFIIVLACLILNKKNRMTLSLLFLASTALFISGTRGSSFFAITSVYIIGYSFQYFSSEKMWMLKGKKFRFGRIFYFLIIFTLTTKIIQVINNQFYYHQQYHRTVTSELFLETPDVVIDALVQANITGKVFSKDTFGGYMIWKTYPTLKPFSDSRQYNQKMFIWYALVLYQPQKYFSIAQERYGFNIALIEMTDHKILKYLKDNSEWQLIALDGKCMAFVKNGVFNLPKKMADLESSLESEFFDSDQFAHFRTVSRTSPIESLRQVYYPPPQCIDLLYQAEMLYVIGYKNAALNRLFESLKINPVLTIKKYTELFI